MLETKDKVFIGCIVVGIIAMFLVVANMDASDCTAKKFQVLCDDQGVAYSMHHTADGILASPLINPDGSARMCTSIEGERITMRYLRDSPNQ